MAMTDYAWSQVGDYYVDSESGMDTNAGTVQSPKKTIVAAMALATGGSKTIIIHGGYFNEKITLLSAAGPSYIYGDKMSNFDGSGLVSSIWLFFGSGTYGGAISTKYFYISNYVTLFVPNGYNSHNMTNSILKNIGTIPMFETFSNYYNICLFINITNYAIRSLIATPKFNFNNTHIAISNLDIYRTTYIGAILNDSNVLHIFDSSFNGTITNIRFMDKPDIGYSVFANNCAFKLGQKTPSISSYSSSTGTLITTTDIHGFYSGQSITISGYGGTGSYNGTWTVELISATTFYPLNTGVRITYSDNHATKGTLTNNNVLCTSTYQTITQLQTLCTNNTLWTQGSDSELTFMRKAIAYAFTGGYTLYLSYLIGCKVVSDIQFVSKQNEDFRLQSTSPAVNIGTLGENAGMFGIGKSGLIFPDSYDDSQFVNMKLVTATTQNTTTHTNGNVKITSVAHGLATNNRLKFLNSTVSAYNKYDSITVIDVDNFYMNNTTWASNGTIDYKYWSGMINDTTQATSSIVTNIINEPNITEIYQLYVTGVFAYRNREVLDNALNVDVQLSSSDALTVDKRYVVEDAFITYNSVSYNVGDKFNCVTGFTSFTGVGHVRKYLELTNKQMVNVKMSVGNNPTLSGCSWISTEINKNILTATYDTNGNLTSSTAGTLKLYALYHQYQYIIQIFEKI